MLRGESCGNFLTLMRVRARTRALQGDCRKMVAHLSGRTVAQVTPPPFDGVSAKFPILQVRQWGAGPQGRPRQVSDDQAVTPQVFIESGYTAVT